MTESRETLRRRLYRERAPEVASGGPVRLDELCIVHGCLELRVDANCCHEHRGDEAPQRHICPACQPRNSKGDK